MSYNKKTWVSNEIITKEALNRYQMQCNYLNLIRG